MKPISKQPSKHLFLSILIILIFIISCKKEDNIENQNLKLKPRSSVSNLLSNFATISNTSIKTTIQGEIWHNKNNCCTLIPVSYLQAESMSSQIIVYTAINGMKRLRFLPNQFWSTHSLKISENNYLDSGGNFYLQ